MANSTLLKATACLVLIAAAMVVAPLLTEAAPPPPKISCGNVTSTLAPCFEYVLSGGKVPPNCCAGVKSLYKAASTTAYRRNVCLCLKSVTSSASPAAIKNAKSLPGKCGITLPIEITPTIDCNK
ncbi:hypothetical protein CDL12_19222 [Handroanthus impetiginosus]|nr:hypothetical protein CDL12_19222 [Handroanthus impetiginosus]